MSPCDIFYRFYRKRHFTLRGKYDMAAFSVIVYIRPVPQEPEVEYNMKVKEDR